MNRTSGKAELTNFVLSSPEGWRPRASDERSRRARFYRSTARRPRQGDPTGDIWRRRGQKLPRFLRRMRLRAYEAPTRPTRGGATGRSRALYRRPARHRAVTLQEECGLITASLLHGEGEKQRRVPRRRSAWIGCTYQARAASCSGRECQGYSSATSPPITRQTLGHAKRAPRRPRRRARPRLRHSLATTCSNRRRPAASRPARPQRPRTTQSTRRTSDASAASRAQPPESQKE